MIEQAIFFAHKHLFSCDNVGESDDWRDLSYLVDYLAFTMERSLSGHPCRKGCDSCCRLIFPVTSLEWKNISAFLDRTGRLEAFRKLAKERYRSKSALLEEYASLWTGGDERRVPEPISCPFLEEGACGIYPVRPLVCRGYGFFAVWIGGERNLLMCPAAGEALKKKISDEQAVPLPMWDLYRRRLSELNYGKMVAPLPLWLLLEGMN
ncbi:MAG TPA: YkgJ family cysteine cluster protein [Chroococcales cyanobacterium]